MFRTTKFVTALGIARRETMNYSVATTPVQVLFSLLPFINSIRLTISLVVLNNLQKVTVTTWCGFSGLFRCKGESFCLPRDKVCDGVVGCPKHRDDEKYCSIPGNNRVFHESIGIHSL